MTMRTARLDFDRDFHVALTGARAQVATMTLAPGESTGGPDNRHVGADQWLYVVSGEGEAVVEGETHALRPGTLLLIERGEAHEIRCTGDAPLRTLDFYDPPAYDDDGDPLPAGESG
jgi:mannose-6-phosphate isomerase-like protein (cupin superfamily)